jgi:DNA-directed RNA polymerase subunit M/transcription elongation factor TFIIS
MTTLKDFSLVVGMRERRKLKEGYQKAMSDLARMTHVIAGKLTCRICGNTTFTIYSEFKQPKEEDKEPLLVVECTKCLTKHTVESADD